MSKPILLDLFCGAGGASRGYHDAGFYVIGVDIERQSNYPYDQYTYDAMILLQYLLDGKPLEVHMSSDFPSEYIYLEDISAIHASPPCQRYSVVSKCRPGLAAKYPDLIEPLRELLKKTGLPYVIENVPGAPLINPVELCGCFFGMYANWPGQGRVQLIRKRLFEANFPVRNALHPKIGHVHRYPAITVAGHGHGKKAKYRGKGQAETARKVMEIDWMTRDELNEAIPPVYTNYIGIYLKYYLEGKVDSNEEDGFSW